MRAISFFSRWAEEPAAPRGARATATRRTLMAYADVRRHSARHAAMARRQVRLARLRAIYAHFADIAVCHHAISAAVFRNYFVTLEVDHTC